MAEREGFEPPIPFQVWPLSRRLVSTTHAPLRLLWCRACSAPMIALVAKAFSSRSGPSDEKPKLLQALHLAGLLIVSSGLKKRLQNFATLICPNPCGHLHPMIDPRMFDHLQRRTRGAGLWFAGSILRPVPPLGGMLCALAFFWRLRSCGFRFLTHSRREGGKEAQSAATLLDPGLQSTSNQGALSNHKHTSNGRP